MNNTKDACSFIETKIKRKLTKGETKIIDNIYSYLAFEIAVEGKSHPNANSNEQEYYEEVYNRFHDKYLL